MLSNIQEEWDKEYNYYKLPKGADEVIGKKVFPDGLEVKMIAQAFNLSEILSLQREKIDAEWRSKIKARKSEIFIDYPDTEDGRKAKYENMCRIAELDELLK